MSEEKVRINLKNNVTHHTNNESQPGESGIDTCMNRIRTLKCNNATSEKKTKKMG